MNRTTTHPGDVLKEELEARGISQKKFSEVLSVPYTQLNEILNGKRPVTTDFALMMEVALGINPEMLINMQSRYNMSVAKQKKSLLRTAQQRNLPASAPEVQTDTRIYVSFLFFLRFVAVVCLQTICHPRKCLRKHLYHDNHNMLTNLLYMISS